MKTKIVTILTILIVSAATLQAQVQFGLLGGVNFQNISGQDDDGVEFQNSLMIGFHGGANVNIPVAPDFYLQPGVLYSLKGAKTNDAFVSTKASGDKSTTVKLSYIEVPINFLFRPQFGDGHILLGFGPYVAFAIDGSAKYQSGSISLEYDVRFAKTVSELNDDLFPYYKRLDAGANLYAGYEFSMGLFLQFNTQLGLLKINSDVEGDTGEQLIKRNTGFGLSAGFRF